MLKTPTISINNKKISDDIISDFGVISNTDNETVLKGYERLREDVETVLIHQTDDDCDGDDDDCNENNKVNLHNKLFCLNGKNDNKNNECDNKIKINLSQEKIFGTKDLKIDSMFDTTPSLKNIKKSRSASFGYPSILLSPILVKENEDTRKTNNNNNNEIEAKANPLIYDVPKRRTSVPINLGSKKMTYADVMKPLIEVKNEDSINLDSSSNSSPSQASVKTVVTAIKITPIPESPKITLKLKNENLSSTSPAVSSISQTQFQSGIARFLEDKYKCKICLNPYTDPRVLECLHSFCCHCLMALDSDKPNTETNIWTKLSDGNDIEWNFSVSGKNDNTISQSGSVSGTSQNENVTNDILEPRLSIVSGRTLGRRNRNASSRSSIRGRNSSSISFGTKLKLIICPVCNTPSEIPAGGVSRLTHNFILSRQTDAALVKIGTEANTADLCNLCSSDIQSTFFCTTCNTNMCAFCKESHLRQRITSNHDVKPLSEARKNSNIELMSNRKKNIKCSIHSTHDIKLFCTTCNQVACSDCTILIHRGHKCESITKASKMYIKLVRNSLEKTRPVNDYANHMLSKLTSLTKKVNNKCENVQREVETFMTEYFLALEVHRKTLFNQIVRARDNKTEMIKIQQSNLEKRAKDTKTAIQFTEDLLVFGNDVEILSFVGILMKRFDHCRSSEKNLELKITDSLQFLPEVAAPSSKPQNNIPLYGIITTQTAVPKFCTLETKELMNLRVHRKAELTIASRDNSDRPLCHGGLLLAAELRYKDASARLIPIQISDKRDGTYIISFVPDTSGLMTLVVFIQGKPIKGNPFTLCARTLRPHYGIYHCCSFCSSGGLKTATCGCGGHMEGGYLGCGHGHEGHPGRRHWSCCANILENSECTKANVITFPTQ